MVCLLLQYNVKKFNNIKFTISRDSFSTEALAQ
jgi:hypothetical protein